MSRRCPVAAISVAKGCAIASVTLLTISSASPAIAQETAGLASPSAFRVCADPHDLPFSDTQGDGFENKIAELVAHDLKLPVQYTFFPDSQGFVRATLLKDRCDVIMGIAVGAGDITTTSAYYHTGYMMVTRDADHITANTVGEPALAGKQFGLIGGTPPTNLLVAHDLMDQTHLYDLMIDTRVEQPAHTMLTDLVAKRIDVGLLWGPFAGYYIKHDHLPLHAVFLDSTGAKVRLDYHIAMGVRDGDTDFRRKLNQIIVQEQPQITKILHDYGIPLLDEQGRPIPAP
jgi:quinoprotein dehydrogenase-associated probable ABC transporter substrate-binding protein